MAFTQSYDVEFDDSLLDQAGWKNPRYDGSKLTGVAINRYTAGDITYGLNPVIVNKVVALYIGNTLIGEGEEDAYTEITNHSYATVDRILLINLEDDAVQIIDRQNTDSLAFRRHVDRDLFEGSVINFKLLDFSVENALKPRHAIKFNRGSLQKVYAYTANTGGFEDGVFGGAGSRSLPGQFVDNLDTATLGGGATGIRGMFGYGSTSITARPESASLFSTASIQFVETLPAELAKYSGDVNTATLGLQLNLPTQSFDPSTAVTAVVADPNISVDDGTSATGGGTATGGGGPSNK